MRQIEFERKIILWTELKLRVSTQRSVKEQKNEEKAERLKKINNLLRSAKSAKALIDQELSGFVTSKPATKPSKKDFDEFETRMNLSVVNTEGYNQKIAVVTSELKKKKYLLEKSIISLLAKSRTFNFFAETVFEKEDRECQIELVKAFKEFEEVFISIGTYNSHCTFLQKDIDYLSKAMINSQI
jgi:hypothetical protein